MTNTAPPKQYDDIGDALHACKDGWHEAGDYLWVEGMLHKFIGIEVSKSHCSCCGDREIKYARIKVVGKTITHCL